LQQYKLEVSILANVRSRSGMALLERKNVQYFNHRAMGDKPVILSVIGHDSKKQPFSACGLSIISSSHWCLSKCCKPPSQALHHWTRPSERYIT